MGIKRTSTLSSTSLTSQPFRTAVWIAKTSKKLAGFYPKFSSLIRAIPSTICFDPVSDMAEVIKLHGAWPSAFSCRVIWALKLKGIPYENIEEDLPYRKSPELLKYNPVHKKIPVLVHGEKPICESMIIIEYIEETWPETPLLPADPYDRAIARFWVKFADDKGPSIWMVFRTTGEEQVKFKKESLEMLKTIEEHAGTLGKKKFFGGDNIGIVDIAFGGIAHWFGVIEDVVGVKLFEAQVFPRLHAWTENFKQVPAIKENLPDRDKLVVFYKQMRENLLASS